MQAIRAHFDGKKIQVPKELRKAPAGEVLVIIPDVCASESDEASWMRAQEASFAKIWDNDEDSVYDSL